MLEVEKAKVDSRNCQAVGSSSGHRGRRSVCLSFVFLRYCFCSLFSLNAFGDAHIFGYRNYLAAYSLAAIYFRLTHRHNGKQKNQDQAASYIIVVFYFKRDEQNDQLDGCWLLLEKGA